MAPKTFKQLMDSAIVGILKEAERDINNDISKLFAKMYNEEKQTTCSLKPFIEAIEDKLFSTLKIVEKLKALKTK